MKLSGPKSLLHLEGLCVLVAACWVYQLGGFAWWKFGVLFLAPDLAMVGYVWGTKVGAPIYNSAHTYVAVAVLWLIGHWFSISALTPLCLIWLAHIGFDRMLGYGLKYPDYFKHTHLGRV